MVQLIFNLLIILVLSVAMYMSQDWPEETALFPRAIGFPILALSVVSLIIGLVRARREWTSVERDIAPSDRSFVVSATGIFSWLVSLALAIWALGFPFAIPLFVLSYMKVQGKLGWLTSILWTALATAFVFLFFGWMLQVSWPHGALWKMFGF